MELQGVIIKELEPQGGISQSGREWSRRTFVLETLGDYPKKVCFVIMNDAAKQVTAQAGDLVTVKFDLESREWNGRWYTDVRAFSVTLHPETVRAEAEPELPVAAPRRLGSDENDDLPF